MITQVWRNALRFRDLRAEHRQTLTFAFLAGIGLSSPLWFITGHVLYEWFKLDPCMCVPIRDQSGGLLYTGALMGFGLLWIGVCSFGSRAVLGMWRVRRGQLPREELFGLVLGRYPDGWYEPQSGAVNSAHRQW
ncbi:hypothetical protein K2Z84_08480 [Candidatus Binatia bacterium]|jgi:hypothetical protein|nr:hypothetical protein [Candidatus Binatia bacterium]